MDKLLLLLEAPVFLLLWLIYHPPAVFQPPNLFAFDFMQVAPYPTVLGLCALWSVCFGYMAAAVILKIRKKKSKAPQGSHLTDRSLS